MQDWNINDCIIRISLMKVKNRKKICHFCCQKPKSAIEILYPVHPNILLFKKITEAMTIGDLLLFQSCKDFEQVLKNFETAEQKVIDQNRLTYFLNKTSSVRYAIGSADIILNNPNYLS